MRCRRSRECLCVIWYHGRLARVFDSGARARRPWYEIWVNKGLAVLKISRLSCGILCLFTGIAAVAQPMADRLPPTTLVYSGWTPNAAMQTTKAARMLADERLIQPWRAVLQKSLLSMPDDLADGGLKLSEHIPSLLADAAQCEGCFALLELKPSKGEVIPQAVLILKLGARRADFEAHFKPIHAKLKERLGERLQMMKLENSWLWVKSARDKPEYTWGFLGDSFVFYFGDRADQFIPTLSAKLDQSLLNSPGFVDCFSKLPGDSALTTYVDLKSSLGLLQGFVKESNDDGLRLLSTNWQKIAVDLGLDNIRSLGEKTTIQDEQFVTRSLIRTDGPPHGLAASLVQPAVDDAMLKAIPPDALFAAAARVDLSKLYAQIKASAINVAGEDGRKAFGQIEDAAAGFGEPVNNLLDPLGDQWVLYEAASTGGFLFTGLTLIVDVKDADKMGRTLVTLKKILMDAFANDDRIASGAYEVDGVTIQYIDAAHGFEIFNPAWAVVDKKLIVALYPQMVEDAIRQLKSPKSLLDNADFAATRKLTGGGGPIFYLSGQEFVRTVYPLLLPIVSQLRESFLGEPAAGRAISIATLFPSYQHLLQLVGTDAVSVKLTPDGILRTKSVANPLLSPLTPADSIPLWVALSLPSMSIAKVSADRVHSALNLRQIGQGMVLYANDHQGKLPPDLATLLKQPDFKREAFQSPFGEGKAESDYKYFYVEGLTNAVPPDILLAYDAAELEKGDGANVLYGDGRVEWLDAEVVAAAIQKAAKWREELKRK